MYELNSKRLGEKGGMEGGGERSVGSFPTHITVDCYNKLCAHTHS